MGLGSGDIGGRERELVGERGREGWGKSERERECGRDETKQQYSIMINKWEENLSRQGENTTHLHTDTNKATATDVDTDTSTSVDTHVDTYITKYCLLTDLYS